MHHRPRALRDDSAARTDRHNFAQRPLHRPSVEQGPAEAASVVRQEGEQEAEAAYAVRQEGDQEAEAARVERLEGVQEVEVVWEVRQEAVDSASTRTRRQPSGGAGRPRHTRHFTMIAYGGNTRPQLREQRNRDREETPNSLQETLLPPARALNTSAWGM